MGRGERNGYMCNGKRRAHSRYTDTEDSDEDYVAEEDETDEQSDDDLKSLVGDDSEGASFSNFVEEEEDDEKNGWRKIVKPRPGKGSLGLRKNGTKRPRKRLKAAFDEEEDDFDDEDEDEDEEFTLDEIESLDEEEEAYVIKRKTKKRGRPNRTNHIRKQTRQRSAKVARKPLKKESKKTNSLRKKDNSDDDDDFETSIPVLREKSRKKPGRRKRKAVVISDADSVCSESSSDFEFTISDEEREQVSANEICGRLAANLRCSRRIQEVGTFHQPRKPRVAKGKEKAEDTNNDVGKQICGICLTEETKNTVRGTLDCCSHFFCFACIMEWSKVESRCPLCKQRFATISKPARCVKGFDLRNMVMQVPVRDQVYQPSEEELRDYLDPYENVICTECHQGGDDSLMLLCDLCDSPAHTYCVGLGHEVPEGNWYCYGCRPSLLGSSHSEAHDLTPDRRTGTGTSDATSAYENMAEIDLNVTIPETPLTQGNGFLSSPRHPNGGFQPSPSGSGMGVSTVSGRRLIHRQIQHIIRMTQMNTRTDRGSASNLRSSSFGSGNNGAFFPTLHQTATPNVGTVQHSSYVNRLRENSLSLAQRRESFPGSLSHVTVHMAQASTSTGGSTRSNVQWSGIDHTSSGANHEQLLRPCTSRTSAALDRFSSSWHRDQYHR